MKWTFRITFGVFPNQPCLLCVLRVLCGESSRRFIFEAGVAFSNQRSAISIQPDSLRITRRDLFSLVCFCFENPSGRIRIGDRLDHCPGDIVAGGVRQIPFGIPTILEAMP